MSSSMPPSQPSPLNPPATVSTALLDAIRSPKDLRKLPLDDLATLAGEKTISSASVPSTPYRSAPSAALASAASRVRVRRCAAVGPSAGAAGSSRTVRTYPSRDSLHP